MIGKVNKKDILHGVSNSAFDASNGTQKKLDVKIVNLTDGGRKSY